jgi:predicted transposase YbfD/YdcC
LVQGFSEVAGRHPLARHVQPGDLCAGPGGDGKRLCGLGGFHCQADLRRGGGHRRQGRGSRRQVFVRGGWKATGKTGSETRYYLTSLKPDAARLNQVIGQHRGIENKLHRALDVSFGEDLDRKRQKNAAQNFSLLNRIALNLLKEDKTCTLGIKGKRLKAGWDNDYLLQLLGN